MSAANIITAITASGLPFVLGRRIAEYSALKDPDGGNKPVSARLLLGTVLPTALCAIFPLSSGIIAKLYNPSKIATICIFLPHAAMTNCFYATFCGALCGKKEYVARSSLEIFEIVLRIGLPLLFFQSLFTAYEGTLRAAMAYSVRCVSTALLSYVFYRLKKGGFSKPKHHIKPIVKSALPVSGIRITGNLFDNGNSGNFHLPHDAKCGLSLTQALAEYGILNGMTLPLIAFPMVFVYAITTTLVPIISADMKTKNFSEVRRHLPQAINYSMEDWE